MSYTPEVCMLLLCSGINAFRNPFSGSLISFLSPVSSATLSTPTLISLSSALRPNLGSVSLTFLGIAQVYWWPLVAVPIRE